MPVAKRFLFARFSSIFTVGFSLGQGLTLAVPRAYSPSAALALAATPLPRLILGDAKVNR